MSDWRDAPVLVPKAFLGITPGPDRSEYQYLSTLSVELEDGTILRVAFPFIALYEAYESDPRAVKSGD